MGTVLDILLLISFLIEVFVLFYLERKSWQTIYTPLNFLMIPYVVVLLITVCISSYFGLVPLYYPSIAFWNIGLLLFAIPSYTFGVLMNHNKRTLNSNISTQEMPKVVTYLAIIISLLFIYRFKTLLGSSKELIGTADFGLEFCGRGFWGHLRQLSMAILVIEIYFLDRRHLWHLVIILILLLVSFMYQVKGWVIIPCIAGYSLRLYNGKSQFKFSLLLWLLIGAFIIFLISYWFVPMLAGGSTDVKYLGFVFEHFFHYLSSGILGLSVDMQKGFPDSGSFDVILTPFINLFNVINGNKEMLSPVNPFFYNTGLNLTNVRTFFGTLYIYSNCIEFVIYTLTLSTIMYMLKLCTIRFNNIYIFTIYFFGCGLLFFGWFEFYFFHIIVIELPVYTIIIMIITILIKPDHNVRQIEFHNSDSIR